MPIYVAPYRKRNSPKMGYSNNLISLDAFITESHNYEASVMTHPVEQGVSITDNIYNNPVELDIEAVISPYGIFEDSRESPQRADEAYRQLMILYNNKVPVMVYTGLRNYTSMAITSITIPRSKENSQTLRYNISFRKVRIVGKIAIEIDTFDSSKTYWENAGLVVTEDENFNPVDKTAVAIGQFNDQQAAVTNGSYGAYYDVDNQDFVENVAYTNSLPKKAEEPLPEINFRQEREIDRNITKSNLKPAPMEKLFF